MQVATYACLYISYIAFWPPILSQAMHDEPQQSLWGLTNKEYAVQLNCPNIPDTRHVVMVYRPTGCDCFEDRQCFYPALKQLGCNWAILY